MRPAEPSGILVVDKPEGMTSMRAVATVRSKAGGVKTGHAGTLDPLATGILVVTLGKATRLSERIMALPKHYHTTIDLSAFTTTDDREGEREEVEVVTIPTRAHVEQAVAELRGRIMQRPPAFSALKVEGRRAYRRARQGEDIELPARPVVIHSIEVLHYKWPELLLNVRCGKGTYIRSLARDIGRSLGTGGHCATLRRLAVGPFDESMAMSLDDHPDPLTAADLISIDDALQLMMKVKEE